MANKYRGEYLTVNDTVDLTIELRDGYGDLINADLYPTISIVSPSGLVILNPTSQGVMQVSPGKYQYSFQIPYNGPYGAYIDKWTATVNGELIDQTFAFIVAHTQFAAINIDGYEKLGDDFGFQYSQNAIRNINKLIKGLRARLNSAGKSKAKDANGNIIYIDCDIYSVDMLVTFLATSLSDFNQIPYFTRFEFDDDEFVGQFYEVLIEGAALYALASMSLLERGLEFAITDNSLSFQPPTVSELLNSQWSTMLSAHNEKLKYIKNSLRPAPLGLGVFSMSSGINPSVSKLRHLRERSFF
jgi:hypothetical protein